MPEFKRKAKIAILGGAAAAAALLLASCGSSENASASSATVATEGVSVGVAKVARKTLERHLTMSSELVPYQEIDVYAKESGYVRKLYVDYGDRVKEGQVMAVLEIPELQLQLTQDDAAINNAKDMVTRAEHELNRVEANAKVRHLQYTRLKGVAESKKGLVAQQEVDDAEGNDLGAQAQVEATKASLQSAQSQLQQAQDKRDRDQVLFDYSKITAPFAGVVTQRYANLGTLMQAGTSSSTQAMPLVQLSEDDRFRLVIPVPETYVHYIKIGDVVDVNVPSLNRTLPGKVARFSVDVREDTRTMHTEVDMANPNHVLVPGLFAEATITLEHKGDALSVPIQAISHNGDETSVLLVDSANKLVERPVKLGIQTASDAEVLSGVKDGDRVVVSDRSGLKNGEVVTPKMVEMVQSTDQGDK